MCIRDRTSRWQRLLTRSVSLERALFHTDGQSQHIVPIQAKYGAAVAVESLDEEHCFVLECTCAPEVLTLSTVIQEFSLVTYSQYLHQCTQAQDQARHSRPAVSQNETIPAATTLLPVTPVSEKAVAELGQFKRELQTKTSFSELSAPLQALLKRFSERYSLSSPAQQLISSAQQLISRVLFVLKFLSLIHISEPTRPY
eukprot:TRINITY_DN38118_c0_g1_i1.p1 TRINITY_DN38118_c0_g1~~TRINITY_DN38118_c0_g1_i1.p1  ORF type:complete len:199 (+),score=43.38 TRINITY_DN38118_c0_g1_i1:110-706(+)